MELTIYHTSPSEINSIHKNGMFEDVLFFSTTPYFMTAVSNPVVYELKAKHSDFCNKSVLADCSDEIAELAFKFEVTNEVAEQLLTEEISAYDVFSCDMASEASWSVQTAQARAAKKLGFLGVKTQDEQGTVYAICMTGKEYILKKVDK